MAQIGETVSTAPTVRAVRAASGDIVATSTVEVEVVWPDPLPDLNYTVVVALEHAANPVDLAWAVRARTVAGATIAVRNTALGTRSCTVHAVAYPD